MIFDNVRWVIYRRVAISNKKILLVPVAFTFTAVNKWPIDFHDWLQASSLCSAGENNSLVTGRLGAVEQERVNLASELFRTFLLLQTHRVKKI